MTDMLSARCEWAGRIHEVACLGQPSCIWSALWAECMVSQRTSAAAMHSTLGGSFAQTLARRARLVPRRDQTAEPLLLCQHRKPTNHVAGPPTRPSKQRFIANSSAIGPYFPLPSLRAGGEGEAAWPRCACCPLSKATAPNSGCYRRMPNGWLRGSASPKKLRPLAYCEPLLSVTDRPDGFAARCCRGTSLLPC